MSHCHGSTPTSLTVPRHLQPHPLRHHPSYSIQVSHKDLVLVLPLSSLTLKAPLISSPHIHFSTICTLMTHRPMATVPPQISRGLISRLTFCISDFAESYSALRLQLNPSKTELIWFGTRCNLNKIPHEHFSLSVGSSIVPSSAVVRFLGVLLDIWNSLPVNIRPIDSHPSFRRVLKTHLFNIAFI